MNPATRDPGFFSQTSKRLCITIWKPWAPESSELRAGVEQETSVAGAIELAIAMSITQDRFDEVVKESMEDFEMGW